MADPPATGPAPSEAPPAVSSSMAVVAVGEARTASDTGFTTAIVASGDVHTALGVTKEQLASIKQLATQTKAIGVILPPPDIRAIVDKTASFVARNGVWGQQHVGPQKQTERGGGGPACAVQCRLSHWPRISAWRWPRISTTPISASTC